MPVSPQKDLFAVPTAAIGNRLVLELKGIPAPHSLRDQSVKHRLRHQSVKHRLHYHIPSFKNSKRWITKLPNGKPLKRPLLITSPEFQVWMAKAVQSLESQLLSKCQTGDDATPQVRSKLFAMLSLLPEDDSVNDLREGSWKVVRVPPGEEGASILIERL